MPPGVINMSRMLVLNGPRQGVAICLKLRSRTVASGTSVNDIVGYVFNVSCTMAIIGSSGKSCNKGEHCACCRADLQLDRTLQPKRSRKTIRYNSHLSPSGRVRC